MSQLQSASDELLDYYTKTASNIITYYEGDERKSKLEKLRELVKQNCIQEQKLKKAHEAKNTLLQSYELSNPDTNIENVIEEYKEAVNKIKDVSTGFVANRLTEYERRVEALLHNNQDNDDDTDNDDDDLRVKGGYVNTIDPVSKKTIVNPVKNSVCGHTYDRDTITELLKLNKNTRCPVIGCKSTQFVLLTNLKTDIVTQTFLEKQSTQ